MMRRNSLSQATQGNGRCGGAERRGGAACGGLAWRVCGSRFSLCSCQTLPNCAGEAWGAWYREERQGGAARGAGRRAARARLH